MRGRLLPPRAGLRYHRGRVNELSLSQNPRSPVNVRSILLGLLGVVLICTLTPYNDLAVNNTPLTGNYLPLGLLLFFLTFILLINGPLLRFFPRSAFSAGELAVALGMVMVGCSVPASGLMRYLPATLVGVTNQPVLYPEYVKVLRDLDLPQWIFPTVHQTDPLLRASDPVIQQYWYRAPAASSSLLDHLRAVPWGAWVTPAITWGIFLLAFWGAILSLAVIVRKQWVENERLPFPIAQIYLSLIAPPDRGKMFNALFRSRGFWIAAGTVFVIHFFNAMWQYDPKHWPKIPLDYDLTKLLNRPPFAFMEPEGAAGDLMGFKRNAIVFSIVGITFFLQTKVAFSLWFFYLFYQVERVIWGYQQSEFTYPQQQDQQLGSMIPFALALLWVGREHWWHVIRSMFRWGRAGNVPRRHEGTKIGTKELESSAAGSPLVDSFAPSRLRDSPSRYLPYGVAGWATVFCLLIMIGWLVAAGCTVIGAAVLVLLIMMVMLVTARVVAETGLLFVQLGFPYWRPWVLGITPPLNVRTSIKTFFYHGMFSMILGHDVRETTSVFATHALKVADEVQSDEATKRRSDGGKSESSPSSLRRSVASSLTRFPFLASLATSLIVAYLVSGIAMLHVEYAHGVTLDTRHEVPLNAWGTEHGPYSYIMTKTAAYTPPRKGPSEVHNRWAHFFFGFGTVSALSVLRLRFAWWPLHPVGLLIAYGWPIKQIWFSIFLGWLLKILIVRFGGMGLFRMARNIFIGLIIGEAAAAGFWLIVCLVLSAKGVDYRQIRLFPS
jgi:hypothetical protein